MEQQQQQQQRDMDAPNDEQEVIIQTNTNQSPIHLDTVIIRTAATALPSQIATLHEGIITHLPRRRAFASFRANLQQTNSPAIIAEGTPSLTHTVRPPWVPTVEEDARYRIQRRTELLYELRRKQRSSCKFCVIISLAPIILLFIRLFAPITEDISPSACRSKGDLLSQSYGKDSNLIITCAPEKGHFINAFTSRCLCTAMDIINLSYANQTNATNNTTSATVLGPVLYP